MDYMTFGYSLTAQAPASRRTLRAEHAGRSIWIKQKTPSKSGPWHAAQRGIALCLRYPILRATVSSGEASCRREAARLREFKAGGWHVPEVLAVNDDMLIMSDLGPSLKAFLDKTPDPETRLTVLRTAAGTLARLHQGGLVHGRPYLRDMTWDGTQIGFLDLEENPATVMPLEAAQARDVWIFLSSACRFAQAGEDKYAYDKSVIDLLFREYCRRARPAVLEELRTFVRLLKPLRLVSPGFIWRRVGSDVRQSAIVTDYLAGALKEDPDTRAPAPFRT
jgi:tRNA A-37 threonylcarbamoyl transferase component Bud32